MGSYEITDFKSGMDLRKMYATAPAGSLRLLRNAVITPGAEIEKRNAFVAAYTTPVGSFGLISRNAMLYVIEPGASGIVDPTIDDVGVVTLPAPAGKTFHHVADWDLFDGDFYIVMHTTDDTYVHYYRQTQVTDAMATSQFIRTYGEKMYGLDGRLLRFSAIGDPTLWTPPTDPTLANGSGFIDLSAQDADSTDLVGMEVYQNQMAIFSELSTQFWTLDPDPQNNAFKQLLRQTGLIARHALTQFGSGDVMYLSPYGIRSLHVQNISLTAGTTDIGTPIDEPIRDLIWAQGKEWFATSRMLIQPRTGRLWLILPDRAYVLSTFQEPAITAWSIFDFPFGVEESVISDPYIYIRADDGKIYFYGGSHLDVFDNTEAEVITPALSFDKPNVTKLYLSFDIACEGTWGVYASLDPTNQEAEELVATCTDSTFLTGIDVMPGQSTHISMRLRTTDAGPARLGKIVFAFDAGEEG